VLQVRELSKSFDAKELWRGLKFDVTRGERIGIIGPNGCGKTTLLKTLLGELDADDGEVRWGTNLSIGYYDQRLDEFDPDNTILEEVHDGTYPEKIARDVLGSLLFSGDTVDNKRMGDLSGGERARVALAELMLEKPNVILLDEPTNHLDIQSIDALVSTLGRFDGTLLIVSHDRYFLQKIAGRLLILQPPNMTDFDGSFDAWHERAHAKAAPAAKAPPAKPQAKPAAKPVAKPAATATKDNPYTRPFGKLSVQTLEAEIAKGEAALAACQTRFAEPATARDPGKAKKLQQEVETLTQRVRDLEAEYFLRSE
jgi:ATP-binding cassette subfamily F protein 3